MNSYIILTDDNKWVASYDQITKKELRTEIKRIQKKDQFRENYIYAYRVDGITNPTITAPPYGKE